MKIGDVLIAKKDFEISLDYTYSGATYIGGVNISPGFIIKFKKNQKYTIDKMYNIQKSYMQKGKVSNFFKGVTISKKAHLLSLYTLFIINGCTFNETELETNFYTLKEIRKLKFDQINENW